MNRSIRDIADLHAPKYEQISFLVKQDAVHWSLNDKNFVCSVKGAQCLIEKPTGSKVLPDNDYLTTGCQLFQDLLRMPRLEVKTLNLDFTNVPRRSIDIPNGLSVRSLTVSSRSFSDARTVLSRVRTGVLEDVSLTTNESFDVATSGLFGMEQWKQAKRVCLFGSRAVGMDLLMNEFVKFKTFKLNVNMNIEQDLARIRDTLSTTRNFESCELRVILSFADFHHFEQVTGEQIDERVDCELKLFYRYPIPDTNEILEFRIDFFQSDRFYIERKMKN